MNPKRLFLVAAIASSIVVWSVPLAHAAGPSAGCPPAFQGPFTFEQIIKKYPPPPDLPDPEGVLAGFDHNGDELLCVQEVPEAAPAPINTIDNTAAT
jgi:hypothetical protein